MSQFFLEGVGPVLIRKSNKAKRVSIRIKSRNEVQLVIPARIPLLVGKKFAAEKKDWIIKHLEKASKIGKSTRIFNEQTAFNTKWHRLKICNEERENIGIHINSDIIRISYPTQLMVDHPKVQEAIKYGIHETLKMEALDYIPGRLEQLAVKYDFSYRKLNLKNQKTLWGSCSSSNNINININVMRLPQHLLDYILVHELAHTVHKNHSLNFWNAVSQCIGNGKALSKELRNYRIEIFH